MIYILPTARKGKLIKSHSKKTIVAFGRRDTEQYWKTVRSCGNLLTTPLEYRKFREVSLSTFILCFWRYKHDKRSFVEKIHAQDCVAILAMKDQPFCYNSQQRSKIPGNEVVWQCCQKWTSILTEKNQGWALNLANYGQRNTMAF